MNNTMQYDLADMRGQQSIERQGKHVLPCGHE